MVESSGLIAICLTIILLPVAGYASTAIRRWDDFLVYECLAVFVAFLAMLTWLCSEQKDRATENQIMQYETKIIDLGWILEDSSSFPVIALSEEDIASIDNDNAMKTSIFRNGHLSKNIEHTFHHWNR